MEHGPLNLLVHPNPASNSFFVYFSLKGILAVQIEVFDVTGRNMLPIMEPRWFSEGPHSVELSSEKWASGVYLVRLMAPGSSAFTRIIKG